MKCPRCHFPNSSGKFCNNCGQVLSLRYNTKVLVPLILVVSCIFSCFLCGLVGSITDKKQNVSTVANSTPRQLVSTQPSPTQTQSQTSISSEANSNLALQAKINKDTRLGSISIDKKANIIISGTTLLAAKKGKVIGKIPLDEEVEVISQSGAMFNVRTSQGTGWIHGNNIRFRENKVTTTAAAENKSSATVKRKSEKINSSGASALCRDGTLSYSSSRRGTCSHHGGVAQWY